MPKSKKIPVHICGVFDLKTKKVVKVSLDEDEIDTEIAFMDEERFSKCEFDILLEL